MSAPTMTEPEFIGGPLDGDLVEKVCGGKTEAPNLTVSNFLIGGKVPSRGTYKYSRTDAGDYAFVRQVEP